MRFCHSRCYDFLFEKHVSPPGGRCELAIGFELNNKLAAQHFAET